MHKVTGLTRSRYNNIFSVFFVSSIPGAQSPEFDTVVVK